MPDLIEHPKSEPPPSRSGLQSSSVFDGSRQPRRRFVPFSGLIRFYAQREVVGAPIFFGTLILILALALYMLLIRGADAPVWDHYDEQAIATLTPPASGDARRGATATATILVEPADAFIFVDDSFSGIGPLHSVDLAFGTRLISFERSGYASVDTLIRVSTEADHLLTIRLEPSFADSVPGTDASSAGSELVANQDNRTPASESADEPILTAALIISVEPSDAELFIDGRAIGHGSAFLSALRPGTYSISSYLDGHTPGSQQVTLGAGDSRHLALSLTPVRLPDGELAITVSPWGSIYVDGELLARDTDVRFVTAVRPGTRRVRATHPALGSTELTVEVQPAITTSVIIDLVP